ncbi:hypothetical protein EJB05_29802 [Eragrostis curvula]|uniref:Hexosyltransferase n=1 Tax=Eragrostis curvula TaxID=38414 RepID=A0A5J9UUA3_9POAL|nr:hypothetical protein EJB05_29802 [Eragrostis curvula]
MKGHHQQHSSPLSPPKRRCSGLAAAVPALVVCSILLPLVFLLGLHRPGYGSEEHSAVVISTELDFGARKHLDGGTMKHKLLKDVSKKKTYGSNGISAEKSSKLKFKNLAVKSKAKLKGAFSLTDLKNDTFRNNGPQTLKRYQLKDFSQGSKDATVNGNENHDQETVHEENPKSCELEYGSYCLWSVEHREVIKDAVVKRLKDQLFMARAHYPSIAKLKNQERFTRELKQNIQEHERMLSDTIADADLPLFFGKKLEKMEHTIERAKSCEVGCSSVERKLRQNVLAASTTINSAVMNSKDSGSIVFHLFTDAQNFYAMKHWFNRNSYLEATVHVTNIEDHHKISKDVDSLEMQQLWPAEEFRVTIHNHSEHSQRQMKTEYISVFGHSHFLLPNLLPKLNRVVVLDDDLIVQKDLSSLWNLNMGGKVIGAVQFCGVRLGQLRAYMAEHKFNINSCMWMSGLNVVELERWRDLRITSLYDQLLQKLQKDSLTSQQLKSLPASLLAFEDLIYPLEDSWVQSGLGHDYGINSIDIEQAATLHYNGVMKPWLDLGIHDYKSYWRNYMTTRERFMTECNIH